VTNIQKLENRQGPVIANSNDDSVQTTSSFNLFSRNETTLQVKEEATSKKENSNNP
jgi:hypothetical protein